MKKEFETFVRRIEDLREGEETPLVIRDLAQGHKKYGARYVRATLSKDLKKFPEGDILWVRSTVGNKYPSPYALKITGELPDLVPGAPYDDVFAALKRLLTGTDK